MGDIVLGQHLAHIGAAGGVTDHSSAAADQGDGLVACQLQVSALRYTDEDLMNTKHTWELQPRPYVVLHLDAALRGIGNASCGPETMLKYQIPQKPMSYKLRISAL